MKRILHPSAEIEFEEAAAWYRRTDQDLANDFVVEVEKTADQILANPLIFNARKNQVRRANLSRFPYYIPFRIQEQTIQILAIAHNARKPGYWTDRLA